MTYDPPFWADKKSYEAGFDDGEESASLTPLHVWIVGDQDDGDNGWSVERVFLSREEADAFCAANKPHGHWEIEKHVVGDREGDFHASRVWEEPSYAGGVLPPPRPFTPRREDE